ncbi:MAG: ABC transporter ATP-binding protein [Patescibacteria group bacterium]|nr:ABC transporter ATP-binding protein [Patescibacteria group bacterium]MDE2437770.1 ABC transporter ATP-binding protein [Patescibacteria group bacterium]
MKISVIKNFFAELKKEPPVAEELNVLKRQATYVFVWLVIAEVFLFAQIYPVKWFFDGFRHAMSYRMLLVICGAIFVLYGIGSLVRCEMDNRRNQFYFRFWKLLWGYGHRKELRLDTAWHVAHSTGEKESVLAKNILKAENLIDNMLFDTVPTCVRIVLTCIGMWWIGWQFGLFAMGTVMLYAATLFRNETNIAPLRKSFRAQMKRIERDGTELTQNWRTLKQFGIEEEQANEHEEKLMQLCVDERWRHRAFTAYLVRQEHVVTVTRALMYYIVACAFFPTMNAGLAVLVTMWMERMFTRMSNLTDFQRHMNEGGEAVAELVEQFSIIPDIRQANEPRWDGSARGTIEFRNVSLSYPDGKQDALKDINLLVQPNTTVALVGYSGGGKTTFASLLAREYDPTEGSIMIGGVDLHDIDYARYRKQGISIVSQDVQLFDTTVRENIRMVRPDALQGYEEICAQRAYADEFIRELRDGYDTDIGEDGIRLSGGQRQRLAIARALYRDPDILIFDEATSSLDAVSQEYVQKATERLIAERACTIFIIAHRFSTIMSADLVVVLNDGKLEAVGTHEELARGNGIYRRLRDLEMRGVFCE